MTEKNLENISVVTSPLGTKTCLFVHRIVSSTFKIVQILVQSHFELISSVLALEATEPLAEPIAELAVELINNHLISVHQKR